MELQIQNLVSSIRKEGIEAANKEAEAIIAEAKKKADAIVADAKTEAQQYKDSAEKDIAILRENAAVSAEQAKRDAVLAFKSEIQKEFEKILASDIRKELDQDNLGKLIKAAVAGEDVSKYAAEDKQYAAGSQDSGGKNYYGKNETEKNGQEESSGLQNRRCGFQIPERRQIHRGDRLL